jgi:GrpB-like predicted nucleotidyltransferase (UPF0157 family)/ketosteroid isomerase-like protein
MPENEVDDIGATEGVGVMADEPVRIVPYDPSWPERFEEERAALADVISDWVFGGIHHVGSTSVSGLEAKPVIDILVGVRGLEESRSCFDRLGTLGYLYAPYRSSEMHWFCKPHPSRRTHHLHLVPDGSPRFRDELAFRDYLRAHRDVAEEYGALKRRLAKEFEHDREAYTNAKAEFIGATVQRAVDHLVLRSAYRAFNARDIDAALELMHPEVDWPNAWEGGRVVGHAAVREYWNRQFAVISSNVEPLRFTKESDGSIIVDVHQVVHDAHTGELLSDSSVRHSYRLRDGMIAKMDVLEPNASRP